MTVSPGGNPSATQTNPRQEHKKINTPPGMKVPAKLTPGTTLGNIAATALVQRIPSFTTALLRGIDLRADISASHCGPQLLEPVLLGRTCLVQKLRLTVLSFAKVCAFRT
jgi:hypothetical protein